MKRRDTSCEYIEAAFAGTRARLPIPTTVNHNRLEVYHDNICLFYDLPPQIYLTSCVGILDLKTGHEACYPITYYSDFEGTYFERFLSHPVEGLILSGEIAAWLALHKRLLVSTREECRQIVEKLIVAHINIGRLKLQPVHFGVKSKDSSLWSITWQKEMFHVQERVQQHAIDVHAMYNKAKRCLDIADALV